MQCTQSPLAGLHPAFTPTCLLAPRPMICSQKQKPSQTCSHVAEASSACQAELLRTCLQCAWLQSRYEDRYREKSNCSKSSSNTHTQNAHAQSTMSAKQAAWSMHTPSCVCVSRTSKMPSICLVCALTELQVRAELFQRWFFRSELQL